MYYILQIDFLNRYMTFKLPLNVTSYIVVKYESFMSISIKLIYTT